MLDTGYDPTKPQKRVANYGKLLFVKPNRYINELDIDEYFDDQLPGIVISNLDKDFLFINIINIEKVISYIYIQYNKIRVSVPEIDLVFFNRKEEIICQKRIENGEVRVLFDDIRFSTL